MTDGNVFPNSVPRQPEPEPEEAGLVAIADALIGLAGAVRELAGAVRRRST